MRDTNNNSGSEFNPIFTPTMTIGEVIDLYPEIRAWLPVLSAKYKQLTNPVTFRIMSKIATLDTVAERGGFTTDELIGHLSDWVKQQDETK